MKLNQLTINGLTFAILIALIPKVIFSQNVNINGKEKQKYDVAAYVWPSYHPDDRAKIFWPEGIGEWQTVMKNKPKFEGHEQPRYPLWGYINEADPYVAEMEINSWNEWTETSYLMPCTMYGYSYLEAVKKVFGDTNNRF